MTYALGKPWFWYAVPALEGGLAHAIYRNPTSTGFLTFISTGARLSMGLWTFGYACICPQQNPWQMHDDMRKIHPTGKKKYKQPLLVLLYCREDSKFEPNHFMRSPPITTTTVLVDSVSLDWGLLHLGWIPCFYHSAILWKSWGEELVRNPSSQKQQHTPPKQRSLDNLRPFWSFDWISTPWCSGTCSSDLPLLCMYSVALLLSLSPCFLFPPYPVISFSWY